MTLSWGRGTALLFTAELAINCEGEPGVGDKPEPSGKKIHPLFWPSCMGLKISRRVCLLVFWAKIIRQDLIFWNGLRNWLNQEVIFFLNICAVMFEYHSGRSGCANKTSLQPIYLPQSMSRIPTMSQRLDQEWESECVICNWALIWQLFSSLATIFLIWQLFSAVTASSLFSPTD